MAKIHVSKHSYFHLLVEVGHSYTFGDQGNAQSLFSLMWKFMDPDFIRILGGALV